MSLHTVAGTAQTSTLSSLLLRLRVVGSSGKLRWLAVTRTHNIDYSNTGTQLDDAAFLWISRSEFAAMAEAFECQSSIPVCITFDDAYDKNNVRLVCYLDRRISFSRQALTITLDCHSF